VAKDRVELSTLRISDRTKEATYGSGTPLPLFSLETSPSRYRASVICSQLLRYSITSASPRFAIERLSRTLIISGRKSSSRTRTIEKRFLRLFERSDRLLLGNSWEIFQEIGERLSGLEIVDQRLERHTCADEHRRPAHDFGIAVDDGLRVHDEAILPAEGGRPSHFAFRKAGTRTAPWMRRARVNGGLGRVYPVSTQY
jgi:hypothetical protein